MEGPAKLRDDEIPDYVRKARTLIDEKLPAGAVVPQHSGAGHFYGVPSGAVYPSVTGKLKHVKDESIQNFAMNSALGFVEENMHKCIVDGKVDMMKAIDLFTEAKKVPSGLLHAAGDIGTMIHDRREQYMQAWIDSDRFDVRPDIVDFIKTGDDPRLQAGMAGLELFLQETKYIPIRTEVMVYSDKMEVAGMLDDIGVIWHKPKKKSKGKWQLALVDLKTSNQMKAHYWLQVAMYHMMFEGLTGLKPDLNMILKIDKDQPRFKVEYLKDIRRLKAGAISVLNTAKCMDFIKESRKDNDKTVIKI